MRFSFGRRGVRASYLICGMPRSGTTLCAELLGGTGLVGIAREFFDPRKEPPWAVLDYPAFVAQTMAEKARNGVFGAKLIDDHLPHVLARLRAAGVAAGGSDRDVLERVLPAPRYVQIQRRDVLAQAVSWWKAHQTRHWYRLRDRPAPPVPWCQFDFDEISRCISELEQGNVAWEQWFAANGIAPFTVAYEELAADLAGTTRRILDFLGVDAGPEVRIEPRSARQFDGLNEEWIARYRELAAARGRSATVLSGPA